MWQEMCSLGWHGYSCVCGFRLPIADRVLKYPNSRALGPEFNTLSGFGYLRPYSSGKLFRVPAGGVFLETLYPTKALTPKPLNPKPLNL